MNPSLPSEVQLSPSFFVAKLGGYSEYSLIELCNVLVLDRSKWNFYGLSRKKQASVIYIIWHWHTFQTLFRKLKFVYVET